LKDDGGNLGRTNQEQKKRVDLGCGERVGTGKVLEGLMDCGLCNHAWRTRVRIEREREREREREIVQSAPGVCVVAVAVAVAGTRMKTTGTGSST